MNPRATLRCGAKACEKRIIDRMRTGWRLAYRDSHTGSTIWRYYCSEACRATQRGTLPNEIGFVRAERNPRIGVRRAG